MVGHRRTRLSVGEKAGPYLAPWLLTIAAMLVAIAVHFTIGNDPKWMAILGGSFAIMTLGTWFTWKTRKPETRLTATVFTGAMLGWVALAGAGVPWKGDMLKAYAVGGMCGSIFWMLRHAGLTAGHEKDQVKDGGGGGFMERISAFKNSRVTSVKESADELRGRFNLEAPTTASDAQHARDQIASVSGVGSDQVKVIKVKGDESKVDVVLNRAVDTTQPIHYRGPSAPGQSIAAVPLYLGRRTDGSDIGYWVVGSTDPENPRPLAHTKCTGVTGSGKTETICTAILDMRWRTDVVPVVADPAKFQQSFGDIEECLGLAAKNPQDTKQLIRNLIDVVEYRSELLGSLERSDGAQGYKQWEPECYTLHGVPAVWVDVEEAADVANDMDEELDEAVRKLRSLGIHLCLSMQTMPHDNLSRKTRGQFGQSLAHGQLEYQDAKYALNINTLEAGADPTKWGNAAPGSLYAETVGTDKSHWPVDGRAVYMTAAHKHMSIGQSRQFWADLDEGTYARLAYLIDPAVTPAEDEDDEDEYGEEMEMSPNAATAGVSGADPHTPLNPPRKGLGIQFSDAPAEPVRMSTEDARARLQDRLRILEESDQRMVKASDLADLPTEVGRSPGWLYENLGLLAAAGRLKEFRPPEGGVLYEIIKRYPEAG
jgi:hypothetical protein